VTAYYQINVAFHGEPLIVAHRKCVQCYDYIRSSSPKLADNRLPTYRVVEGTWSGRRHRSGLSQQQAKDGTRTPPSSQ
jgi:hypothetical protein